MRLLPFFLLFFEGLFQFTHPGRGATEGFYRLSVEDQVSIHAPREGCDQGEDTAIAGELLVSIHAPREGCDDFVWLTNSPRVVSIHAPREGCDSVVQSCVL